MNDWHISNQVANGGLNRLFFLRLLLIIGCFAVEYAMAEKIWDKETGVPQRVIEYVDENVLSSRISSILCIYLSNKLELPAGTQLNGIIPHGTSYWTRTAKIATTQFDGSSLSFFIKVFMSC